MGASSAVRWHLLLDLFDHEAHAVMASFTDSQCCRAHIGWSRFGQSMMLWLSIENSDIELLTTLNLLLTAVSSSVSVAPVSKIKIQSRLGDFFSLNNVTTSLSVNSGFSQQSHELWPVFYS